MRTIHRREFLGAAAGAILAAPSVLRAGEVSRKVKVGLIGCGWYGMVDIKAALKAGGVEVLAVCDVDSEHLRLSAEEMEKTAGSRPKTFKRYEELLDVPGLEAVFIATPPHWHALPFIAACRKGLHIYCEKPVAFDIREGRAMVDAAKGTDRVIQIGFQRRQSAAFREVKDFIRAGNLGRVVQVDVGINYAASMKDSKPQDPPPSLDWDLWCGPAPKLPYSPNIGHFAWRLEATTGNGHLVDWGIHLIDGIRRILDQGVPRAVQAAGGTYFFKDQITTPDVLTAHFEFDRCPVVWRHRIWGAEEHGPAEIQNGIFFYGEKGTVFATDEAWTWIPRGKGGERKTNRPAPADMGVRHVEAFLEAVRGSSDPPRTQKKENPCPIDDAFRSTATVQLAMIAYRTGARIEWDADREEIPGSPAAAALLKREYRAPWKHPHAG
jgi:predicted dehydrogenase